MQHVPPGPRHAAAALIASVTFADEMLTGLDPYTAQLAAFRREMGARAHELETVQHNVAVYTAANDAAAASAALYRRDMLRWELAVLDLAQAHLLAHLGQRPPQTAPHHNSRRRRG
jgi:hypothetical protein